MLLSCPTVAAAAAWSAQTARNHCNDSAMRLLQWDRRGRREAGVCRGITVYAVSGP